VKYELGLYIPEDDILHSDRRETLRSYGYETTAALAELPNFVAVGISWLDEADLNP
jgi:hypothetical protein